MGRCRVLVLLLAIAIVVAPANARADSSDQAWVGRQESNGDSQALILKLTTNAGVTKGMVDLPDFGALSIPTAKLSMGNGHVHFELVGDETTTVFEGTLRANAIRGSWHDGTHGGAFELNREAAPPPAAIERPAAFANGNVRLSGTMLLPRGRGPFPAIAFVQGAGPEPRSASRFLAELFVAHGVAALIYDKRGVGQSSGDWQTSSFEDLAGDAVAAVHFLRSQPEIRKEQVGLMGSSQGGWIAPMAARASPDVRFVIVKSAAGVTPEQQELARTEIAMRAQGFSQAETEEAVALYRQMIAYAFSGKGWDELTAALEKASHEKWGGFGSFPRDAAFFTFMRLNFRHDPIPVLAALDRPTLVVLGGQDATLPVDVSMARINHALSAHHAGSLMVVFPQAGHDLRVETSAGEPWAFPKFAPGYLELLASWVNGRAAQSP